MVRHFCRWCEEGRSVGEGGARTSISYGPEKDSIILLQRVQSTVGNVSASLLVQVTAPIEVVKVELEAAVDSCELVQDLNGCTDDFRADAVGGYGGNLIDAPRVVNCTRRHEVLNIDIDGAIPRRRSCTPPRMTLRAPVNWSVPSEHGR